MTTQTGRSNLPGRWAISWLKSLEVDWRHAMLAGLVACPFFAYQPVHADEFDIQQSIARRGLSMRNGRCAPPPSSDVGSDQQRRRICWPTKPSTDAMQPRTG